MGGCCSCTAAGQASRCPILKILALANDSPLTPPPQKKHTHTTNTNSRSEDCTIVIDASAGCGSAFPCAVTVTATGETESGYDKLSIWKVTDGTNPTAALLNTANRVSVELSGIINSNLTVASPTGLFIVRFTSDSSVTGAGWAVTWAATPHASTASGRCANRTVTGAEGSVTDGSGDLFYLDK